MFMMIGLFVACGGSASKSEAPAAAPEPKAAVAAVAPVVVDAAVLEALKTADAADGTEDKVATMCSGCALSMSGKAEHSVSVEGYSIHLCSAMCKEYFTKDIAGNLKQLIN